jgi:lysophospholipase L1-like esterase
MGSGLVRNKRAIEYRSIKQVKRRQLHAVTSFFRFSPLVLQLRLLPHWVFGSLIANGVLLAALVFSVRHSGQVAQALITAAADFSGSDAAPTTPAPATQANLTALAASEPRSALGQGLTYEEAKALLAQAAEEAVKQPPNHLTILAGDSISLWFPESLLTPNRTWLNQSISGETTAGLLKRLNLLDRTEPETIFVMIGINDLLRGRSNDVVLQQQQQIIQDLKQTQPQAQIVVQSILPHAAAAATWEGRDRLLQLPNSQIQQLNRELAAIAQAEEVYFLDLYSLFATKQGDLRMDLSTDGLHLNRQGYQTWSIALQVYSQEILEPARADLE